MRTTPTPEEVVEGAKHTIEFAVDDLIGTIKSLQSELRDREETIATFGEALKTVTQQKDELEMELMDTQVKLEKLREQLQSTPSFTTEDAVKWLQDQKKDEDEFPPSPTDSGHYPPQ